MRSIAERIIRLLAAESGIAPTLIRDEHRLREDMQFDSLDCVEFMMALEEEFAIQISEYEFDKLTTVGQVIEHITGVCTASQLTYITSPSPIQIALTGAEDFLRGFENDDSQEGIAEMLAQIGNAIREESQRLKNVAALVQATLAVVCETEALKNNTAPLGFLEKVRISQIVEQCHDALEALGVKYDNEVSPETESDIDRATRLVGTGIEAAA